MFVVILETNDPNGRFPKGDSAMLRSRLPPGKSRLCPSRFFFNTVIIQGFRTDRSGQTVQTQIRLFLEDQSDLGLHCLPFLLHLLNNFLYGKSTFFEF